MLFTAMFLKTVTVPKAPQRLEPKCFTEEPSIQNVAPGMEASRILYKLKRNGYVCTSSGTKRVRFTYGPVVTSLSDELRPGNLFIVWGHKNRLPIMM
jgi:hypothetical protein